MTRKKGLFFFSFILITLMVMSCSAPIRAVPPSPGQTLVPTIDITLPPATGVGKSPTLQAPVTGGQVAARRHADSFAASISADGRFIVYQSSAGDLIDKDLPVCPNATSEAAGQPCQQVYLYDIQSGATSLVTAGPRGDPGNGSSGAAKLSADGRYVVFSSYATNLATSSPSGAAAAPGLFVSDRQAHTITQVAQDAANPAISGDGRYIVYEKGASGGVTNIYLYNRVTGEETLISRPDPAATGDTLGPPGSSYTPAISQDGEWIAFWSWDGHLVPGDEKLCGATNCGDIFLYNRVLQQMTRIPMDAPWGVGMEFYPTSLSADGRWLATANLLYDQTTGQEIRTQLAGGKISADGLWLLAARGPQVYIQPAGQTNLEQVSVSTGGAPANGPLITAVSCMGPPQCQFKTGFDLSADARYVVFDSTADNLDGGDAALCAPPGVIPHNCSDIFVRDRQTRQTTWVTKSVRPAAPAALSLPDVTPLSLTSLERTAEITSARPDGTANPSHTEQAYYLQPGFWRFDTRGNPPAPREPEIESGDGKTIWHYQPGNNTTTIMNGQLRPTQAGREPVLFGRAEGVASLEAFLDRIKGCYPKPVFLGSGDAIAGRPSYVFYLGRATCSGSIVGGAGPETIWLDQQTLVALRWVAQSATSATPLYALTVQEIQLNPALQASWFNHLNVPGAVVIDQRQ